jgi:polyisoprenoid-binding protein YceI
MKQLALAASLLAVLATSALAAPVSGLPGAVSDPAAVRAGSYQLDPAHGKITWSVNHLGLSTYIGQFAEANGTLTLNPRDVPQSRLSITVNMNSIATLNPKLDEILKSDTFFDVAKYPTASFVSTRILRTGRNTANVDGNLTLHGVTRPVVLKVAFNGAAQVPVESAYVAGFDGTTVLKRSDFGVSGYLGYISDEVPVQVEGEFHLQK